MTCKSCQIESISPLTRWLCLEICIASVGLCTRPIQCGQVGLLWLIWSQPISTVHSWRKRNRSANILQYSWLVFWFWCWAGRFFFPVNLGSNFVSQIHGDFRSDFPAQRWWHLMQLTEVLVINALYMARQDILRPSNSMGGCLVGLVGSMVVLMQSSVGATHLLQEIARPSEVPGRTRLVECFGFAENYLLWLLLLLLMMMMMMMIQFLVFFSCPGWTRVSKADQHISLCLNWRFSNFAPGWPQNLGLKVTDREAASICPSDASSAGKVWESYKTHVHPECLH